jgi:hypothetical protein
LPFFVEAGLKPAPTLYRKIPVFKGDQFNEQVFDPGVRHHAAARHSLAHTVLIDPVLITAAATAGSSLCFGGLLWYKNRFVDQ